MTEEQRGTERQKSNDQIAWSVDVVWSVWVFVTVVWQCCLIPTRHFQVIWSASTASSYSYHVKRNEKLPDLFPHHWPLNIACRVHSRLRRQVCSGEWKTNLVKETKLLFTIQISWSFLTSMSIWGAWPL